MSAAGRRRRRGRTATGPARRGRARGSRHGRRRGCGTRPGRGRSAPRAPVAAAAHDAWRNSSLVATRSWARARTRSGSQIRTDPGAGQQADQRLHVADQHRCQRLHALDGVALRQLREQVGQRGMLAGQLGGASPDLVGEQQLAAGRRPQVVDGVERALVGHGEAADLLDVSPQNSTRSGCSSVGGKTSTMPPRTANSPRRSTRSTRDVGGRGQVANEVLEAVLVAACEIDTGARSASPLTCGCSSERTGATTTSSGRSGRRGPAGAAPPGGGRRCPSAARAARAAASPTPGRRPRRRSR